MDFSKNEIKKFKETIDDMIDINLQNAGITKYISAIVYAKNNDGTYNLYIPPDTTNIISNIYNKTGETLNIGDSVELCTKNGSVNNCWIAVKHGASAEPSPTPTFEFPVGSVVITDTNTTPTYTGTWTLIDKEFSSGTGNTGYTINSTNCTEVGTFNWARAGHSITLTVNFTNKVQIADTTLTMFTIDYTTLGITQLSTTYYGQIYSDLAKCAAFISINATNGVFQTVEVIPDNYISAGRTDNRGTFVFVVPMSYMDDAACDKFYWKRTE